MRVLHCIPGMGGGGAERQLACLARPLIARGWDVHVALATGGPNLPRLESGGALIHRLAASSSYDPRLLFQLGGLIRSVKPDLVQVWLVQMEILGGALSSLFGIPWILSERSSLLAYPPSWKNRLRVAIGRRADAIVSNSEGGDRYWRERAGSAVLRFIVPNAVPVDEIELARPSVPDGLPIRDADAVVLAIGRIDHEKNAQRVFDALCQIAERPETVCIMCGDGPLRSSICHQIEQAGLARRVFAPGYVTDLWPLLKRADVVVAAGEFEGRPTAVLEAMAARRTLVVSDIPAHREILDDASAFWTDPRDPRAIAQSVWRALEDRADAERRAAMARSRLTKWSMGAAADEYDRLYRVVLARRSSGRAPGPDRDR